MPEGHTIHRLARDHQRDFAGQRLRVSSPQGRFEAEAADLDRCKLIRVDAYGKHLFYHWSQNRIVHIHLGLYGKFRRYRNPPPPPRGAVRLRVSGRDKAFDLNGPNCCERISEAEFQQIVDRLGPDPLRPDADQDQALQRIGRSRSAIGTLLLNQAVISGVGNVYRAEALFKLGIHPDRPGNGLASEELDSLWQLLVADLAIGVKYNRIITANPRDVGKPYSRMTRHERLLVYKKVDCSRCGDRVSFWTLGGRKIYACETCQT